jgi:hypothetical protein
MIKTQIDLSKYLCTGSDEWTSLVQRKIDELK